MGTALQKEHNLDLFTLQQTKVLLIDDDRTTRRMVSMAIGNYCNLAEAINARGGLTKLMEFEPHIVFLDLDLPDDTGHNILRWIVKNKPDIRVVLFSGYCDTDNLDLAVKHGAHGYVAKPFNPELMMRHICRSPRPH